MLHPATTSNPELAHLQVITVKDACMLLHVERMTLDRWEKQGLVRYVRIGGCVRVPITELERLLTPTPRETRALTHTEAREADHPAT